MSKAEIEFKILVKLNEICIITSKHSLVLIDDTSHIMLLGPFNVKFKSYIVILNHLW
jgi:hypothetical protein